MITLKTTQTYSVPFNRQYRMEFVYLTIERIEMDINNVTPIGYYYFIDENGMVNKLNDIARTPLLWETIFSMEGFLDSLGDTIHLKPNVLQRLYEITLTQLQQEGTSNYGINPDNWILL